ncbi:MAG: radical SAM protein [Campylobacterota bacterium]|nr:radical SAM protein [Campylobacterota bacterium]
MNIIKIISNQNKYYLIDGFSNEIYQLDNQEELTQISIDDLDEFKTHQSLIPTNYEKDIVNNAKTLVLEITEQCNLRCTYCIFDEDYQNERKHNSFNMSKDIVYKAIDNYKTRINNKEAYIVFYGGEPLIRYDFIKDIVNYAKKILGDIVKFSFTTNGIYLTKEKIIFFKDNNFLITVSLDGDKNIHNKYRKDKDKNGSYDTIINNLKYIYYNYLEYYKKNIQINCVVNSAEEFKELNNFFSTNKFVKDINIRFSNQIQNSMELSNHIKKIFTKEHILNLIKFNSLKKHPLEYKYYGDLIKKIKYRILGEKAKDRKVKCIPFSNRTYVRATGETQFCERIENMGITNLDTNSMKTTANLHLKNYQGFIEKECNSCFAYNYCDMCFASFVNNSILDKNITYSKCDSFRKEIKIAFEIYIELMETNKKLLEQF